LTPENSDEEIDSNLEKENNEDQTQKIKIYEKNEVN
jgi:hypothetical protein